MICKYKASEDAVEKVRKNSKKGKENIEKLEKSKNKHYVETTKGGGSLRPDSIKNAMNGKGTGSTTNFNPDGQSGFYGESVLAHELQHAADSDTCQIDPSDKNKNGYPDYEDDAVDAGNDYRDGVGENRRDDYGDLNPDPNKRTPPKPGDSCKCKRGS